MPGQAGGVTPLVSVVIPTYNREGELIRSIRSVLAQTEPRIEVVVVDDASDCDTGAIVEKLEDHRLRYVRLDSNAGPGAARNRGIREARAGLVAFQDSDDEWLPAKLAKQLEALRRGGPEVGVVTCDKLRVLKSGETKYHRTPDVVAGRLLNPRTRFYQTFAFGVQTTLVRRELLERAGGFDEAMRYFEDSELFLRLVQETSFYRVPEPLVLYHETGGLTSNFRAEIAARRRVWRRHCGALIRESPGFWVAEAALLVGHTLTGGVVGRWKGRPDGPEPLEANGPREMASSS